MIEFVLFCVPVLVYLIVQSRGKDRSLKSALNRIGASWGAPSAYGWALMLLVPLLLTSWLAITLVPAEVLGEPGVMIARITSVGAGVSVALRAIGEEVLFRGLLGGVFVRRLRFFWGNLLQAAVFIVPHLPLLLVDIRIWPILPVQFAAGWLLGWLRNKTETFVPGALLHFITNVAAGLIAL
ncbi:MAG: CPBP family intramembrane metalloprotease [Propionibacteriaceae bacterium]|nr:CPBP family intramembrane metalloprotease [Propionibacteriaceae bacterium]